MAFDHRPAAASPGYLPQVATQRGGNPALILEGVEEHACHTIHEQLEGDILHAFLFVNHRGINMWGLYILGLLPPVVWKTGSRCLMMSAMCPAAIGILISLSVEPPWCG